MAAVGLGLLFVLLSGFLVGLVLVLWSCQTAYGVLVPWPGIEPNPLQWKHRVFTTGLPGKPLGSPLQRT